MNPKVGRSLFPVAFMILQLWIAIPLRAQVGSAQISGKVTSSSGAAVADASISVKNVSTGQIVATHSDPSGAYTVQNLVPGDYEVTVSAPGFNPNVTKVTLAEAGAQTVNVSLVTATSNVAAPSLSDLGFPSSETQGNAQLQARLDKRSHMLKMHQRFGLIDTAPLVATVILGAGAGGKKTSSADRWAHLALGSATGDLYFISAYYAIFAPKIPGTKPEGNIRLHKAMAWIHGPGMILTPILGAMAFDQKSKGEHVHGIAQAHGEVAIVTAGAYGVSILAVSLHSGSVSHTAHHVASLLGLGHSDSANTIVEDETSAKP